LPQSFLLNKGLAVWNMSNVVVMNPAATPSTGAAYVAISAGSTGGGAYLNTGVQQPDPGDSTPEQTNHADKDVQGHYVDDSVNDSVGATHFDDIVSRPSVYTVITKAALGPRSH
jgi:hypothetical protein